MSSLTSGKSDAAVWGEKSPSQKRDCGPGFNQAATHSYTEVDTGGDSENV